MVRRPHCRPSCVIHVKASLTGLSGNLERVLALGRTAHLYEHKHRIIALPTLPFALYQIWLFVNQGLNNREQRAALRFIPFSALCFLIGVAFAYFVVFQ